MCTANIIRSPMAAALLARRLQDAGGRAWLASAGLLEAGHPASSEAVATLARRGIDLSGHRTGRLNRELVEEADLVLGMENRHVRAVAVLSGSALERTFTIKDFLRRAVPVGQRSSDEPVADYVARVGLGRELAYLQHDDPADAVADPVGRPRAAFERCAEELDLLTRGVHHYLWDGTGPAHRVGQPGQRPR